MLERGQVDLRRDRAVVGSRVGSSVGRVVASPCGGTRRAGAPAPRYHPPWPAPCSGRPSLRLRSRAGSTDLGPCGARAFFRRLRGDLRPCQHPRAPTVPGSLLAASRSYSSPSTPCGRPVCQTCGVSVRSRGEAADTPDRAPRPRRARGQPCWSDVAPTSVLQAVLAALTTTLAQVTFGAQRDATTGRRGRGEGGRETSAASAGRQKSAAAKGPPCSAQRRRRPPRRPPRSRSGQEGRARRRRRPRRRRPRRPPAKKAPGQEGAGQEGSRHEDRSPRRPPPPRRPPAKKTAAKKTAAKKAATTARKKAAREEGAGHEDAAAAKKRPRPPRQEGSGQEDRPRRRRPAKKVGQEDGHAKRSAGDAPPRRSPPRTSVRRRLAVEVRREALDRGRARRGPRRARADATRLTRRDRRRRGGARGPDA